MKTKLKEKIKYLIEKEIKLFDIEVSLGHTTGIKGRYRIKAKDEVEAIYKAELYLVGDFGKRKIQKVLKKKGLPAGYMPYYHIYYSCSCSYPFCPC